MSGGSYNYAYEGFAFRDLPRAAEKRWSMRNMAEDMLAEGYADAANPIVQLVARLDAIEAWIQAMEDGGFADVMRAYEWWKSCDWSQETFEAELEKWFAGIASTVINEIEITEEAT